MSQFLCFAWASNINEACSLLFLLRVGHLKISFSVFNSRPMGVHAAFVGHAIMRGHGLLKTLGCLRNNSYRSMTLQLDLFDFIYCSYKHQYLKTLIFFGPF